MSCSSSAAAALIRHCRRSCLSTGGFLSSLSLYPPRHRSFATETLIQTKKQSTPIPWLLLSSYKNPNSRYLYDLTSTHDDDPDPDPDHVIGIKLNREIHLPEIAKHILIGSSQGFLFSIDVACSPNIHAVNPLTGSHLPLPLPPTSLLFADDHDYISRFVSPGKRWIEKPIDDDDNEGVTVDSNFNELYPSKIMLSPDLTTVFVFNTPWAEPQFARVGGGSWTSLPSECIWWIDCTFHRGFIYGISCFGDLDVLDYRNHCVVPSLMKNLPGLCISGEIPVFLLESPDGEDLFVVSWELKHPDIDRFDDEVLDSLKYFKVLKLVQKDGDNEKYEWREMESIGDLAMFVGPKFSMSVSTSGLPSSSVIKPNCIYFSDGCGFSRYEFKADMITDAGEYSLEHNLINYIQLRDGSHKLNWPPPLWYMPSTAVC